MNHLKMVDVDDLHFMGTFYQLPVVDLAIFLELNISLQGALDRGKNRATDFIKTLEKKFDTEATFAYHLKNLFFDDYEVYEPLKDLACVHKLTKEVDQIEFATLYFCLNELLREMKKRGVCLICIFQ